MKKAKERRGGMHVCVCTYVIRGASIFSAASKQDITILLEQQAKHGTFGFREGKKVKKGRDFKAPATSDQ